MDAPVNHQSGQYAEAEILIVDDDEIAVMGLQRAIKKLKLANPVRVAKDGVQALEILRGEAGEHKIERPFMILLDINMPRMNGHEFLEVVRGDPALQSSVIFVLTTSDAPDDIMRAYEKNIAGYIVKERPYETFKAMLELVDHYSKIVLFPT